MGAHREITSAFGKLARLQVGERQKAVAACAEQPERLGADFFADILSHDQDPICRWYAIRALGDLRAAKYSDLLIEVLQMPDVQVGKSSLHRICAARIARFGSRLLPRVLALLDDESPQTRLAAADTLGEIGDSRAIPALARSLKCDDRDVRIWAALSLAKIGSEAIPALADAVQGASREQAMIILDALVIIGTSPIVPTVAEIAQKYPDVLGFYFTGNVRERALGFLGTLRQMASSDVPEKALAREILSSLRSCGCELARGKKDE